MTSGWWYVAKQQSFSDDDAQREVGYIGSEYLKPYAYGDHGIWKSASNDDLQKYLGFVGPENAEAASTEYMSSEDSSAEDTSSEDTSSEDTSSEDTSSEDTSSEDTSSEDTSSEDTSSEDTEVKYVAIQDYYTEDPCQLCLTREETVLVMEKSEDGMLINFGCTPLGDLSS